MLGSFPKAKYNAKDKEGVFSKLKNSCGKKKNLNGEKHLSDQYTKAEDWNLI